jgi:hypothetical protein
MSKKNSRRIEGQFVPILVETLDSPAWRVLSLAARRILDRLEIEWARHGGNLNGKLIVTFAQFVAYGVHRNAIGPAIRELVTLGFIEVTEQGCAGNADFRRPNKYRITYYPTADTGPTHEWRLITEDDARMIAQGARRAGSNSANSGIPKKQKPSIGNRTEVGTESVPNLGTESVPTSVRKAYRNLGTENRPRSRSSPSIPLERSGSEPEQEEPEPVMAMAGMTELSMPFADQVETVRIKRTAHAA